MSISSQTTKTGPFLITALPQVIPCGFPFQQASDLLVLDYGPTGSEYDPALVLVLGSDYTVTGGGYNAANEMQTGSITVDSTGTNAVAVNDRLVIMRAAEYNQTTSFTSVGPLTIQQVEQALDKNATLAQQNNEQGTRSLRFENWEFLDGVMLKSARAGNVVGFDSDGNLTFYAFQSGEVLPQSIQGTANQVLVNGSSGTPVTGAVILTLPQSIAINSTVQFQKIGIGTVVGAQNDLTISRSTPTTTAQACVLVSGGITAPAATDLHMNAFRDTTIFTSTVAADAYTSYDAQTTLNGTLAYNHFYGYQVRHTYSGSDTLGVMAGFSTLNMGVTSGTVTKLRGFYVSDASISGGTVSAFDGIYIDQLNATSGATVITAINVAGNNNVSMAGGQLWISSNLAPIVTTTRLDVSFNQTSQQGAAFKNLNVTDTGTYIRFYNSSTVVQGSITQTNSTTTAFNTSSDMRLKENIRAMDDSGAILDAIKPCIFDWKWGGKDNHGFLAQELNDVYPEAVSRGSNEVNAKGDLIQPWGVDFSKLVPVLTAEIKSLRARVRSLEQVNP